MSNTPGQSPPSYALSLKDGNQWHLCADAPLLPWLDKFATILDLNRGIPNGGIKLIYALSNNSTTPPVDPEIRDTHDQTNWIRSYLKSLSVWQHRTTSDVICSLNLIDEKSLRDGISTLEFVNMWFALYPIYRQSITKGGLPFHAALIEKNGVGVLLAAAGETGKSTCCRRLSTDWQPLCDDEALVVLDHQNNPWAHPFPTWSEYLLRGSAKTWDVQNAVPLRGVFFLEQSDDDEAIDLGEGEAAAFVYQSANQVCGRFWRNGSSRFQRNFRQEIFNNGCDLVKKIPAFRLKVDRCGEFWEEIERVLGC